MQCSNKNRVQRGWSHEIGRSRSGILMNLDGLQNRTKMNDIWGPEKMILPVYSIFDLFFDVSF